MKLKKINKILLVVAANILIIVGLFEVTLRVIPDVIPATLLYRFSAELRATIAPGKYSTVADSNLIEREKGFPFRILKPFAKAIYGYSDPGSVNEITMDENGFCNSEGKYRSETLPILALGDSFTWCTTVLPEDAWPHQLSEISGQDVYNLGNPAIGLYEYVHLLKLYGLQKSPKIVILNVYEGNDLRDAIRYYGYLAQDDQADLSKEPLLLKMRKQFDETRIAKHSYAINLLVASLRQIYVSLPSINGDSGIDYRFSLVDGDKKIPFNLQNTDVDEIEIARMLNSEPEKMNIFDDALLDFTSLADKYDFIPVVVFTPTSFSAHGNFVDPGDDDIAVDIDKANLTQREYFSNASTKFGFKFVDTTDELRSIAGNYIDYDKLLYYQTNLHLTALGHKELAKVIANKLSDQ